MRGTQVSLKNTPVSPKSTPVSLNSTQVSLNSSQVSLRVSSLCWGLFMPRMPRLVHASHASHVCLACLASHIVYTRHDANGATDLLTFIQDCMWQECNFAFVGLNRLEHNRGTQGEHLRKYFRQPFLRSLNCFEPFYGIFLCANAV